MSMAGGVACGLQGAAVDVEGPELGRVRDTRVVLPCGGGRMRL